MGRSCSSVTARPYFVQREHVDLNAPPVPPASPTRFRPPSSTKRHLLEDPATLQSAMETEIRAAFTRLSRLAGTPGVGTGASANAHAGGSGGRPPAVRLLTLMSVLRPLLVRDGRVLVQAAANVLRSVEVPGAAGAGSGASGSGDQNGRNVFVTLAAAHKHGHPHGHGGPTSGSDKVPSYCIAVCGYEER